MTGPQFILGEQMNRCAGTLFAALLALGTTACGDDDDIGRFADAAPRPDADTTPDAEPLAPDAPMSPLGPEIAVLVPQASTTFDSDSIVTSSLLTARCEALPNAMTGRLVDITSVTILATAEGASLVAPANPTPARGIFEADLILSALPNGPLTIRCTASDIASPAETNSASNDTFLDLGPEVTVFNPLDSESYANQIDALFRVEADPVAAGDTAAAVASIRAFIGAVELTVTGPNMDGNHGALIDFDAPAFATTLDGPISLTIVGTNSRSSTPTSRTRNVVFMADAAGPAIEITSPPEGALVSGLITISADVSDPAGVDGSTVVATVAFAHEISLMNTGGSTYQALFDTRVLDTSWVFPTIDVRAQDSVGNENVSGRVVALDNRPPLLSLDPPDMREAKFDDETGAIFCSRLFDPLGADSIDDGETVAQLSEIRVRVEDIGNGATATSGVEVPKGGVDNASVQLYILDDEGGALVVDLDGDGVCDAINPDIIPAPVPMTDNEAAVLDLVDIGDKGSSHFAPPETLFTPYELGRGCIDPADSAFPDDVCLFASTKRVIREEVGSNAVIYGIPPLTPLACMGNAFDSAATNISDGWACLAVRAQDTLGNVGISPPLRVCFDIDNPGTSDCNGWGTVTSPPPFPCTDGCTPPESFADSPEFQLRRVDL